MSKPKPIHLVLLAFALVLATLLTLSRCEYFWSDWRPATCMPDWCFCEAIRPGTIAQPANTWSSLGFVLAGLLVLAANAHDTAAHAPLRVANRMTATRAYANVYGIALLCIGLGSTFYHASLTFAGQFFDVMGMYLFACFILLYNLARVTTLRAPKFVIFYVVMNTVLAILLIVLPALRRYLFAMLVLGALALAYWPSGATRQHGKHSYLTGAVLVIVIGFIMFLLDLTKIFCWPQSWLQGHALWHLSGALAAGLLYQHYRTERLATHS